MKKTIVSASFIIFLSCQSNETNFDIGNLTLPSEVSPEIIRVSPNENDSNNSTVLDAIDSMTILKLSNQRLIAEVSKIEFFNHNIFIFDQIAQAILIYDNLGHLKGVIDKTGKGPGEFVKIADFAIDRKKNELVILDQFNRKMLHHDLNGMFKYEIPFRTHARHFAIIGDDYILYNDFNSRWGEVNYNIFISDSSGNVQSHMLPYDESYKATNRVKLTYITSSNESANYIGHYDRDWYKIMSDSIWKAYEIDFGEYNIPSNIVHNYFEAFDGYAHNISYFFENQDYLVFSFFYKNQIFTKYYNKKTQRLLNGLKDVPHVVYYNFALPVKGVFENFFVQVVDAQQYVDLSKKFGHLELGDKRFQSISLSLNQLKYDDNPILIFFSLKPE